MYFPISTVLVASTLLLAGTRATPVTLNTVELTSYDCGVYAKTVSTWYENTLSRRRVNWKTNKAVNNDTRKKLTKKWSDGKESRFRGCNLIFQETKLKQSAMLCAIMCRHVITRALRPVAAGLWTAMRCWVLLGTVRTTACWGDLGTCWPENWAVKTRVKTHNFYQGVRKAETVDLKEGKRHSF